MEKSQNRHPGLDVVRCFALFCVCAVHFFLHSGFYVQTVEGIAMLFMVTLRNGCMICVPLFLMLTGYLNRNKVPGLAYYKKLSKTLYVYLAASFICVFYKMFIRRTGLSVTDAVSGVFSFESAPYSWYIEMYIGLYLLAPFLNILYDGLGTQKARKGLLITLCLLTVLPSMLNIYRFDSLAWWMKPGTDADYQILIPQWWTGVYPITYFYLGSYLRDYPLRLKPRIQLLLMAAVFVLSGLFSFYRSYGGSFVWGSWQDYGSFFVAAQAVLVFSFLAERNYDRLSVKAKRTFAGISELALGAYLISWIFDDAGYALMNRFVSGMIRKMGCSLLIVPLVLTGSLIASAVVQFVYTLIIKGFDGSRRKKREEHASPKG